MLHLRFAIFQPEGVVRPRCRPQPTRRAREPTRCQRNTATSARVGKTRQTQKPRASELTAPEQPPPRHRNTPIDTPSSTNAPGDQTRPRPESCATILPRAHSHGFRRNGNFQPAVQTVILGSTDHENVQESKVGTLCVAKARHPSSICAKSGKNAPSTNRVVLACVLVKTITAPPFGSTSQLLF